MATFLACVCPRKGGLIVFGCLQLLPWRMQFHLSFIFPHLDCIRINCNSSKFFLKFHFVLKKKKKQRKTDFILFTVLWAVFCLDCFIFFWWVVKGVRGNKSEGWGGSPCNDSVWLGVWSLSRTDPPFSPYLYLFYKEERRKGLWTRPMRVNWNYGIVFIVSRKLTSGVNRKL